ncbi:MarR family transcriptional regulator [Nitriliruptoraceae bacterium ZYF776]|nr:MarR family transcriptional regulator [Profundirhabdus halotolerans]
MSDRVPGVDDEAITTFGRLVEVTRRLERVFHATIAQATGLPGSHFELLLRLGRTPGEQLTSSALAAQLAVTSGGATRLVDRVAAQGLVERRSCTEDRRLSYVALTAAGREVLERALEVHRVDLHRELTDRLTADEVARLDATLDRLRTPCDTAGIPTGPAAVPATDAVG